MELSIADADAALTGPGQPFEIEVLPIRGIPTRSWKNGPKSLCQILEGSRAHGERIFLVYEDERYSFEDHFLHAAAFAHVLRDRYGVEKGDRVAIAMRNFPEWPFAFWGAAAAGAVVVPLNAWWTADELSYGLTDSGAKVLVCDGERAERLAEVLPGLGLGGVLVVRPDGPLPAGAEDFGAAVAHPDPNVELPDVDLDPEDDATIFYTSGTTGRPKGAVGTHRNICTNLSNLGYSGARSMMRARARTEAEGSPPPAPPAAAAAAPGTPPAQNSYLLSVPFFHATGCHSVLVANTAGGGKLVMMYRWNPERALELIEREQITSFGGVPSMVMQVLDSPDFAKRDTSSVRGVGYGGAPAPPDLVRRIQEHFPGGSASNGYGLTETSSLTTSNAGADYLRKPDSVGAPVAVCEVKVVDDLGQEMALGEVGELWIKGPNVVRGYWHKPEATAATFTDGWLHTGDVARIDDEGFVYIVDRAKDMIIRGGENIYCVEVEAALYEHPAVADAAVIGIPHPILGEECGAVVQLRRDMPASEEELRQFVAARLAAFKVPVRVWFRDEPLPRNPAGKILKRELREELTGGG